MTLIYDKNINYMKNLDDIKPYFLNFNFFKLFNELNIEIDMDINTFENFNNILVGSTLINLPNL